jgi:hypothetical protein
MSGLPPIPGFPQLPQIGEFLPLPTGASSPFSNQQQNQLIAIANGVPNFNTSVLTSGATDVFNTEQYLIQNNKTLLSVIQSLNTLISNPEEFIDSALGKGFVDSGASGLGAAIYTALGSPNNLPKAAVQSPITTYSSRSGGISIVTGQSVTGGGQVPIVQSAATFVFPAAIRPFVNSIAGQTGTDPNDFWSVLNGLYNFALNSLNSSSGVNLQNISNIIAGFNIGNLLGTGGVQSSSVPYFFPLQNGDSFVSFIQMLLTFGFSPGTVMAEILLTPPSSNATLSFSNNAYGFLSKQTVPASGDPTGQPFAQYVRPIVNVLFGVNPSTMSTTDPFDILYDLITNPSSFISGLFSTNTFSGSTVTPQKLVGDLLSGNVSQFQSDLLDTIASPFSSFFSTTLIPTLAVGLQSYPNNGAIASAQQVFIDTFNGNFGAVPGDLLNMVAISSFAGLGANPISQAVGLGQQIAQMFNNFTKFSTGLFVGHNPSGNYIGLNDSVQFGNTPTGIKAGSSSPGWGSSVTPPNFPSGINGQLQGDLGAAMMLAAAAAGDGYNAIQNINSGISSFLNINFAGSTVSAGAALEQLVSGAYFSANALMLLTTIVSQLVASIMNINNVLNNAGIPTSLGSNGSNFSISSLASLL